jgi:hypothetical protein
MSNVRNERPPATRDVQSHSVPIYLHTAMRCPWVSAMTAHSCAEAPATTAARPLCTSALTSYVHVCFGCPQCMMRHCHADCRRIAGSSKICVPNKCDALQRCLAAGLHTHGQAASWQLTYSQGLQNAAAHHKQLGSTQAWYAVWAWYARYGMRAQPCHNRHVHRCESSHLYLQKAAR